MLAGEFDKPYMKGLQGFLQQEWGSQTIYPPKDSIFRAFNALPFDQVGRLIMLTSYTIRSGQVRSSITCSLTPATRRAYAMYHCQLNNTAEEHHCSVAAPQGPQLVLPAVLLLPAVD